MKTKLILSLLFLSVFFVQQLVCQTEEEIINSHKEEIQNFRNTKDQQMTDSQSSPLSTEQIGRFEGLDYFPIDIKYKVDAQLVVEESQNEVSLNTSSGEKIDLVKYGTVTFNYKGETYTLTVFQNKNLPEFGDNSQQLFIPFTDRTTGRKTNEGGRYLAIEVTGEANTVVVDFNMALNPYSAYNSQYSSIVPPAENTLGPSMSSGERKFEDR